MRQIPATGNVVAEVEGDIGEVEGVLRITAIRLAYSITIPQGAREKAERALETYAEKCPAYQSVKACIDVAWTARMFEV